MATYVRLATTDIIELSTSSSSYIITATHVVVYRVLCSLRSCSSAGCCTFCRQKSLGGLRFNHALGRERGEERAFRAEEEIEDLEVVSLAAPLLTQAEQRRSQSVSPNNLEQ